MKITIFYYIYYGSIISHLHTTLYYSSVSLWPGDPFNEYSSRVGVGHRIILQYYITIVIHFITLYLL